MLWVWGGGHQNVTRGGEQLDVIATQSICNTFKKFVLTPKDFQGAKTQFNSTCWTLFLNKGHPTYQEDEHLATFPMGDVATNSKASTDITYRQSEKELSQNPWALWQKPCNAAHDLPAIGMWKKDIESECCRKLCRQWLNSPLGCHLQIVTQRCFLNKANAQSVFVKCITDTLLSTLQCSKHWFKASFYLHSFLDPLDNFSPSLLTRISESTWVCTTGGGRRWGRDPRQNSMIHRLPIVHVLYCYTHRAIDSKCICFLHSITLLWLWQRFSTWPQTLVRLFWALSQLGLNLWTCVFISALSDFSNNPVKSF